MTLRSLDEQVVPVAARRLRRAVNVLRARQAVLRSRARSWEPASLDTRYGGRRPFRYLLSRPLLGLVVAGAVLVAAVAVAVVREGGDRTTTAGSSGTELVGQGDPPQEALLGPRIGSDVTAYISAATDQLVRASRTDPADQRVALVSFLDYRTPDQVTTLLSSFTVDRVYLRAPAAGNEAASLPVDVHGALADTLRTAYAETAKSRAAAQKAYQGYVDTLRPTSSQDRAFRKLYADFARASGIEARAYAHACACVFAALVTATPTLLLALRGRTGVRAVQVAGRGLTLVQLQVQPLLPEVTGTVPRPSFTKLS